jgi:hypothetical protein
MAVGAALRNELRARAATCEIIEREPSATADAASFLALLSLRFPKAAAPLSVAFAEEDEALDEPHELRITARRLPEHIADRSDLADDLEAVIAEVCWCEWLGGGCWFPLGRVDPTEPDATGWEMEFAVADPDRATAVVVRRLAELGASADTTVHQSGPVWRVHRVYPVAGGQDTEPGTSPDHGGIS